MLLGLSRYVSFNICFHMLLVLLQTLEWWARRCRMRSWSSGRGWVSSLCAQKVYLLWQMIILAPSSQCNQDYFLVGWFVCSRLIQKDNDALSCLLLSQLHRVAFESSWQINLNATWLLWHCGPIKTITRWDWRYLHLLPCSPSAMLSIPRESR